MTLFVLENIDEAHRRKLVTILGTDYVASSLAWVNLPLMAIFGMVIAVIFAPVDPFGSQLLVGIGYGLLIIASSFGHGLGHILSSRLVNAPMTTLIATATVNTTYYDNHEPYPSRVHVGRALGGPVLSFLLGVGAIALEMTAGDNHFLRFFAIVNLVIAAATLSPIPSLDGATILHELRNWRG